MIGQFPTSRGLDSVQSGKLPIAEDITHNTLCLPIYPDLGLCTVINIIETIRDKKILTNNGAKYDVRRRYM